MITTMKKLTNVTVNMIEMVIRRAFCILTVAMVFTIDHAFIVDYITEMWETATLMCLTAMILYTVTKIWMFEKTKPEG